MRIFLLEKNHAERPVPEAWRPMFQQIAGAFAAGDFQLTNHLIEGVAPVDEDSANFFRESVDSYGDNLTPLDEATWERSIYHWTGDEWEFLVDLSTKNERVSDLTLFAKLDEKRGLLRLQSVHVP